MFLYVLSVINLFLLVSSYRSHHSYFTNYKVSSRKLANDDDVWTVRRKIIRTAVSPIIRNNLKSKGRDILVRGDNQIESTKSANKDDTKTQFLITAGLLAVGILTLRLGGRVAFVKVLGLDFITDSGINQNLNDFLVYFQSLNGLQFVGYLFAWIVVKLSCFDSLTILLALASGILFGGLWQGTLAAVSCSTFSSLVCFSLSRYFYRDKAREEISKRPAFRAVDRACSKEGFKTVFVLRLSPILPIPIAAYSYLYGATSLAIPDFLLGTTLGSLKPYALDCYLGLVGKDIMAEANGVAPIYDNDLVLLGVFCVTVLVGTFVTQVASRTWDEMASAAGETGVAGEEADWKRMLGISDSDFPAWTNGPRTALEGAWLRVETVAKDECAVVAEEIKREEMNGLSPLSVMKGQSVDDKYPGNRTIRDYELELPDESNIGRYTTESLVFSFVLLSTLGRLVSDNR